MTVEETSDFEKLSYFLLRPAVNNFSCYVIGYLL
jgi:hypothetical protein